jgi:adenylate cyclase
VQAPVALVWSIAFQYAVEGRRRRQIQKAFSVYLPRHQAERVAESDIDLALGGTEVEATVLFTDLEGFTAMADKLKPEEVSRLLTTYFNRTTRHIQEQDGAIIKYIGDAVLAVWGAPLPVSNPAERAALAACGMIDEGRNEVLGRRLRTRIGIHSGRVLAGNFGSDFRFDYTVIGATTNLASRLEGMNQALGTNILTSETTRSQLSDRLRTRNLGRFRVRGFSEPVQIHEVLGTSAALPIMPEWASLFEEALTRLEHREWSRSETVFRQVLSLRQGVDGPTEFFLRRIATLRDGIWDGIHGPID